MNDKAKILSSLRPFLCLAKIVGLFGCNVDGEKITKSSIFQRFYCAIWLVVTYQVCRDTFPRDINYFDIFIKGKTMGSLLKIVLFFSIASDMLISIFQQKQIIEAFDNIDRYDRRLIDLGFSRKDDVSFYWIFFVLPFVLYFFERAAKTLFYAENMIGFYKRAVTAYHPFMTYFNVVKFSMYVHMIYQRFRYLNEHVTRKIEVVDGLMYKQRAVRIYEVRYLHAKLCDSALILTNVYGHWIIVWCFNTVYNFIEVVNKIIRLRSGNVAFVFHCAKPIILCITCGLASSEANKIARKFVNMIPRSNNAKNTMDRIEMALYVSNHELKFNPLGMGKVNRPFLLALTSIIVTFVSFTLD